MVRNLLLIGVVFLSPGMTAAALPEAFSAEYVIEMAFLKVGEAERTFRHHQNGTATYVSKSRTQGLVALFAREKIVETTLLDLHGERVRPLQYTKDREGRRQRKVFQDYDWQAGVMNIRVNDERKTLPLEEPVFDQSAYQLALMVDLAAGKRDMQYTIATNTRLNQYDIRFIREETLDTELGKLATVVVRRKDDKVTTTLWCAKSLNYLPVLIEHEEKGSSFQARLVKLDGLR